MVVVAGERKDLELFLAQILNELLGLKELFLVGGRCEISGNEDGVDLLFVENGEEGGESVGVEGMATGEEQIEVAEPPF